ncbi:hypothetical protein Ancab_038291 [Ancistrocladus abbreviatus]
MPSAGSMLRQLSGKEGWKSTSKRWNGDNRQFGGHNGVCERSWKQMEGLNMYGYGDNEGLAMKKRVMVVVDQSSRSKHAMMWALTHVANKGDLLTLLHIVPPPTQSRSSDRPSDSSTSSPHLASSLASLCKACNPEVEVEPLLIQGPKLATVLSQVKKLEASVLVLGQKKPSPIINCLFGISSPDDFVEQCINNAECLTIGVKKQKEGMGGYLISTRWQKNFWLLA